MCYSSKVIKVQYVSKHLPQQSNITPVEVVNITLNRAEYSAPKQIKCLTRGLIVSDNTHSVMESIKKSQ